MSGLINNLYPPTMPTWQSSFILGEVCKIYFKPSTLTDFNTIKSLQLMVSNQKTNQNVLVASNNVKIYDSSDVQQDTNGYYITLYNSDIINGFQINTIYKAQIRFGTVVPPTAIMSVSTWLNDNLDNFSEWSTISLLRAISQPIFQLRDLSSEETTTYPQTTLTILGKMTFEDTSETDRLSQYQVKLYQQGALLSSSPLLFAQREADNEINYTLKYQLEENVIYRLTIEYSTLAGYDGAADFIFSAASASLSTLATTISTEENVEKGSIKVKLTATDSTRYNGYITFRRTSSVSNFTIWEDVRVVQIYNSPLNYEWDDITIESGHLYKYGVQASNLNNERGPLITTTEPNMVVFNDMFLGSKAKQLRIRFNQTVSANKRVVTENKVDPMGSKYPYIRRSGQTDYRQYTIGGLISFQMDDEFKPRNELVNSDLLPYYDDYNQKHRINDFNNRIREREFRNAVEDFLFEDNIKILRTTPEGNHLVRLMEINFTPENGLGRMLYSFTATAYEMADYSIDNLNEYDIIKLSDFGYYEVTHIIGAGFNILSTEDATVGGIQSADITQSSDNNYTLLGDDDIQAITYKFYYAQGTWTLVLEDGSSIKLNESPLLGQWERYL